MKRVRNTNHTTSQLKVLLMWALLPIVCFAIAIPMPKWYADIVSVKTGNQNEKIAWSRIVLNSPDVVFQNVDSISYFNQALREDFKKNHFMAADVTHLFPDYKAKKITLLNQPELISESSPIVAVWENNGSFFYANLNRSNDGDFYFVVNSNGQSKAINVGKFAGSLSFVPKHTIDLATTTLNVVAIVALLLSLLGYGIMLSSQTSKRSAEADFLYWIVFGATALLTLYVGFWLFDGPAFFAKRYDYPEWIAVAWLLSEVGLLGGILFKMKVESNPPTYPQKSEKE